MPDLIQEFSVRLEELRFTMRGIANVVVPPIRVRTMLTSVRHAIGWSRNFLVCQLRKTKAWKEAYKKMRIRLQNVEHVYDGCGLDDVETGIKVMEFLDRAM